MRVDFELDAGEPELHAVRAAASATTAARQADLGSHFSAVRGIRKRAGGSNITVTSVPAASDAG
jgi:hypothetical protein